jgi:hypothetical protein
MANKNHVQGGIVPEANKGRIFDGKKWGGIRMNIVAVLIVLIALLSSCSPKVISNKGTPIDTVDFTDSQEIYDNFFSLEKGRQENRRSIEDIESRLKRVEKTVEMREDACPCK